MNQPVVALDIPRLLSGIAPNWASKSACAILGIGLAVVLRFVSDHIAPGAATFAFVYPAALMATLLGGWEAGMGTMAVSEALAWIFVMPSANPGGGHTPLQVTSAIIVTITVIAVIAAGEGFRVALQKIVAERNAKLAERELLFRELQHRVNNDFALVNSLLELQRRKSGDPETRRALEQAIGRIRSVARVHQHLYTLPEIGAIDIRQYLRDLCAALAEATLPSAGVYLRCHCEEAYMPRSRAIAVGLATNELITNAIKHAFPEGREGDIDVRFEKTETGWCLSVRDNGVGLAATQHPKTGLGAGLIEEFVRQAGGTLSLETNNGTIARLALPANAASQQPGDGTRVPA
ncbi:MAG TPA: histidine kinase dimerization/phosphoacceptor domain -containing protein [Rhizomicrobium sp.]|nr:histidine kinase dimerization/phosphoacceptor domain -containing protein [Rhizomicrobium sp.]